MFIHMLCVTAQSEKNVVIDTPLLLVVNSYVQYVQTV